MKVSLVLVQLIGITLVAEAGFTAPSIWAVLVAGSNGWFNYRHQADICHAYQILVRKGVPRERIILMMYDDIANNDMNPHKGEIYNRPNGTNVYKGVVIDYKGKDVNVENFKNVLLGNKEALKGKGTGRALESGPNDHIFINFVDHGATGLLSFPDESLYANDFIQILKQMRNEDKYGEMVLYIEACESGSMFDNLLGHYDNILASTAAAPDESSYGWYCDDGTCLGDLFSISWMNRMEQLNFSESLFEQFDAVRTETLQRSHANLYGDYRLGFIQFGRFSTNSNGMDSIDGNSDENDHDSGVDSRNIPLHFAQKEVEKAKDFVTYKEKREDLDKIVKGRAFGDTLISEILEHFTKGDSFLKYELENKRHTLNEGMFDCYKAILSSFESSCYKVSKHTYFLKHLYKFANICLRGYEAAEVIEVIERICNQQNNFFELIV